MIRTLIIEDEPDQAEGLSSLLHRFCPNVQVLRTAIDKQEAIEAILELHPDLVILDIQLMGEKNAGFEVLKSVEFIDFELIILTSHTEYALQAVNLERRVAHFLKKPVQIEETILALQKVTLNLQSKQLADLQKSPSEKIVLPNLHGVDIIPFRNIIRCEADTWLTKVYIKDKLSFLPVSKNLGWFLQKLPESIFIRVHNSHIVNFNYVIAYNTKDGPLLILNGGETVPVGPKFKDTVLVKIAGL